MLLVRQMGVSLRRQRNGGYWCFLAVWVLAIALRLVDLPTKWLWYDELQSVTHSGLPVEELLRSVRAFDPHPPLYYLQLHFWMLFGTSDWWIKLNSVVWSVLALIMVLLLSKDLFNSRLALLASLIFAVSPFAVAYAQEARMYSLLMFLGVGSFYFFRRFVVRQSWLYLLGAISFAEGFLYSHGAGFLILVSLGTYAILILLESQFRQWKVFLKLCAALLGMIVLYIPWLRIASSISVGHTLRPSLSDVISTLFVLLGGFSASPAWLKWSVVILFTAGTLACFLDSANARAMAIAFAAVPVVFCILVSYLDRPIWLYRTLAYLAPFWSIVLAYNVLHAGQVIRHQANRLRVRYALVFTVMSMLICATILQQATFSRSWQFRDASQFLRSAAQKGDVIYVPNERVFWGIAWYLIGPRSVDPLTTSYSLVAATGASVVSKTALAVPLDNATYWLVYRTIDDIAPFADMPSSKSDWDFGNLRVVRIRE